MAQVEDLGISSTHNIFAHMGFFFREQPKHDFGIDAHVETSDENNKGTGRLLALQVKSGNSYYKVDKDGQIVHSTDERHIKYWAEHSLPVVLVIYNPTQDSAWWIDVKAYISRYPSLLSNKPHVIRIPPEQKLTQNNKNDFSQLAYQSTHALSLERPLFSFMSVDDISTAQAKRYRAEILVGDYVNDDIVRLAIYQATQELRGMVEHASSRQEQVWGNQPPHLVTLFVYKNLEDRVDTNWIARSLWRDPSNKGAQLVEWKTNDKVGDINIDFKDVSSHQAWKTFIADKIITKTEFIKKVEQQLPQIDKLIADARALFQSLTNTQITQEFFDKSMTKLAEEYSILERNSRDLTKARFECADAELRFNLTRGSGYNVFLPFTLRGLETWGEVSRRMYLFQSYLQRYSEDREMLGFEMKKLKK